MTILEALKKEVGMRVSNGDRWLVRLDHYDQFVVYEHKRYARTQIIVYEGPSESEAVEALLK